MTYTVTISNPATDPSSGLPNTYVAYNALFKDTVPAQITPSTATCAATGTGTTCPAGTISVSPQPIQATIPSIAPGGTVTITITGTANTIVNAGTPPTTSVPNSATVTVSTGNTNTGTSTSNTVTTTINGFGIGNRVWFDTNNNGVLDGTEKGIDGVLVDLLDGTTGNPTGKTTTTANGGYYLFDNLAPGSYKIQIDASNFTGAGVLVGYNNSATGVNAATNTADSHNNGMSSNLANGVHNTSGVINLTEGNIPTGEGDLGTLGNGSNPDPNVNLTLDFGYYKLSVGDQVWLDKNNNNIFDLGESPAPGITVNLLAADKTTVVATATTGIAGTYLFTVDSTGKPLQACTAYYVQITPAPPNPDTPSGSAQQGVNNYNNGTQVSLGNIISSQFDLAPGGVSCGNGVPTLGQTSDDATGTTSNLTLDFGLVPLSIGNRVWFDTNNNGILDNGEQGINGVKMDLLDGAGNQLATMPTANGGYYRFDNLPQGNYRVRVDAANFAAGAVLYGYNNSTFHMDAANNSLDSRNNGIGSNLANGVYNTSGLINLTPGNIPTGENDLGPGDSGISDGAANLTVDFGYYQLKIGDFLWTETDNNGIYNNPPESGIGQGITVNLLAADKTTVVNSTTTNMSSNYDFVVDGTGKPLKACTTYYVQIVLTGPPYGYAASQPTFYGINNENNGTQQGSGTILSAPILLSTDNVTCTGSAGQVADNTTGITSNLTIDFGLVPKLNVTFLSIGNRVWYDTNDNGILDNGEVGIQGVLVDLLDGSGNPTGKTTPTDASGYYRFDNLAPGSYIVQIDASNFAANGALAGYRTSEAHVDAANNNGGNTQNALDNHNNGLTVLPGTAVRSGVINLTIGNIALGETDLSTTDKTLIDAHANLTIDFGFYRLTIGDQLWKDANSNGIFDNAEVPVGAGITVNLLAANKTTILATTTTDASGLYHFNTPANPYQLQANTTYYIQVIPPAGTTASPVVVTGVNNDNNGVSSGGPGSPIYSGAFQIVPGSTSNGQTLDNSTGSTSNLTLDFGLVDTSGANIYSIGNRVWFDTNNNGILDNGEQGINRVKVDLLNATTHVLMQNFTTANGGYYRFDGLAAGQYQVQIDASNFAAGGVLYGYQNSTFKVNAANNRTDSQNNGLTSSLPIGTGNTSGIIYLGPKVCNAAATPPVTTNCVPTGETDLGGPSDSSLVDANSNLTIDFGYYKLSIGDFLWIDFSANAATNNNGIFDAGENPIGANITVNLLNKAKGVIATTKTDAAGKYSFTADANGKPILQGCTTYYVEVVVPPGSYHASIIPGGVPIPGTNNDNVGAQATLTAPSISPAFQLAPGNAACAANNVTTAGQVADNTTGTTSNLTLDFGFVPGVNSSLFSIGNRVWFDTNNNGKLDAGESGIDGVKVNLLNQGGQTIASTVTAGGGYYRFDNLQPGSYRVQLDASNFSGTGLLVGYNNSSTHVDAATNKIDSQNNGLSSTLPTGVNNTSGLINLSATTLPPAANQTDLGPGDSAVLSKANLTLDFGYYHLAVGDQLWIDSSTNAPTNNNGIFDLAFETSAGSAIQVNLLAADKTTILNTTYTDVNGKYSFDQDKTGKPLQPGTTYYIQVVPPANAYVASTPVFSGINNENNGTQQGATILSASFQLTPGATTGGQTVTSATGTTINPTLDFGLIPNANVTLYSIGNRVWDDKNNNGQLDAGELGIGLVKLNLLDARTNKIIAFTFTDSSGYYRFDNLLQGQYRVQVDSSNMALAGPLYGWTNSSPSQLTINNVKVNTPVNAATNTGAKAIDRLNNGLSSGTTSGVITLSPTTIPPAASQNSDLGPGDNAVIATANLLIDFGYYQTARGPGNGGNGGGGNPSGLVGVADPAITKLGDPSLARPGDSVTFTITVNNKGTVAATNVVITDPVPSQLQIVNATATAGTVTVSGNTVTDDIGTVNPGQTVTITIVTKVPPGVTPAQFCTSNSVGETYAEGTERTASADLCVTKGVLPATGEHPDDAAAPSPWLPAILIMLIAGLFGTGRLLRHKASRQSAE